MTLLRMLAFRPDWGEDPDSRAAPKKSARPRPRSQSNGSAESRARLEPARAEAEPEETPVGPEDWGRLLSEADVRGAARQLGEHCALEQRSGNRLSLVLAPDNAHLNTDQVRGRLQSALRERLGDAVTLTISVGELPGATPAQIRAAGEDERMRSAREAIERDPAVKEVQAAFDAVLEADSIQPRDDYQDDHRGRERGSG